MRTRTLLAALFSTLLLTSVLASAPVEAASHSAPAVGAAAKYKPWGKATGKTQKLRPGCHRYTFNYVVKAPTNQWAAEIILVNPNKRALASFAIDSGYDKARGKLKTTICRYSTVYGKHKLKMKVTWNRNRELHDGWVKPTTFRLKRK